LNLKRDQVYIVKTGKAPFSNGEIVGGTWVVLSLGNPMYNKKNFHSIRPGGENYGDCRRFSKKEKLAGGVKAVIHNTARVRRFGLVPSSVWSEIAIPKN